MSQNLSELSTLGKVVLSMANWCGRTKNQI